MSLNLNKSTWKRVALGAVAAASKERVDPTTGDVDRYVAGEHMDSGELRIRRWGEVGDGYLGPAFHRRFHPGQVLYGSRRTYLRKVAVAEFSGVTANTTFVVETKDPDALLQEFLPFVMMAEPFHAFSIQESKGSVNPYVNWSDIARYEVDLPPIDEQKRLADLFWSFERHKLGLADVRNAAENAQRLLLTMAFQAADLARQPLGNAVHSSAYGPRFSSSLYSDEADYRLLRTTDLDAMGNVDYGSMPKARLDSSYDSHLLKDGDFLISRSGTCGVPAVFDVDQGGEKVVPGAFLIRLRLNDRLDPHYLRAYFNSIPGREQTSALAQGGVQKNIRGSSLLAAEVPMPDRATQEALLDQLDDFEGATTKIDQELACLAEARRNVSIAVFGGQ